MLTGSYPRFLTFFQKFPDLIDKGHITLPSLYFRSKGQGEALGLYGGGERCYR